MPKKMKKFKATMKEIKQREAAEREADLAAEADLVAEFDAKKLTELQDRWPAIVRKIEGLLDRGYSAKRAGYAIRRANMGWWFESKSVESAARALMAEREGQR